MAIQATSSLSAARNKASQSEVAEDVIRKYILEHHLEPGDPLPPTTEFARVLDMSRNSVREAIKSLEAVGVIVSRPGTGLFVGSFSLDLMVHNFSYGMQVDFKRISDLLELRFCLEYGMAEVVVRSMTPKQHESLRDALQKMERAMERGHYSLAADQEFHVALLAHIDNPLMKQISSVYWTVMETLPGGVRTAIEEKRPDPKMTYARHVVMVKALTARNVPALREAVIEHYVGVDAPYGVPGLATPQREFARRRENA
jgi:DNA-binding FadR family transcriptional regulator